MSENATVFEAIAVKTINVGSAGASGSAAVPEIIFGDGGTGFYEGAANQIYGTFNGTLTLIMDGTNVKGAAAASGGIRLVSGLLATPAILPYNEDINTGLFGDGSDTLSVGVGGVLGLKLLEVSSHVLRVEETHVGLTADTGSVQGGGVLLSSNNVISTCANAGDAVTLPAAFGVGTIVRIKNDGAQSCDVFPASGDDLGAGANTAAALAAGSSITYIGTVANSTWTSIGN